MRYVSGDTAILKPLRLALLLPLLAACTSLSQTADLSCGDAGPNTYYFPAGTFFDPDYKDAREGQASDAFSREWYSPHLQAMREPSLSCGLDAGVESYRFLWLPTFDQPVAVRISHRENHYTLDAVILHGGGGYNPDKIEKRIHRDLTEAEWLRAIAALAGIHFADLPTVERWFITVDPDTGDEVFISTNDGTTVIVEGRSSSYHAVERHEELTDVKGVSLTFLDLAGIKISVEERDSLDYSVRRGAKP